MHLNLLATFLGLSVMMTFEYQGDVPFRGVYGGTFNVVLTNVRRVGAGGVDRQ